MVSDCVMFKGNGGACSCYLFNLFRLFVCLFTVAMVFGDDVHKHNYRFLASLWNISSANARVNGEH